MSKLIRHIVLDKLAKKAYHQDDGSQQEPEMPIPQRFQKKWPHLMDENASEQYEGGQGQNETPQPKKSGGIFGKSSDKDDEEKQNEIKWLQMNERQRNDRVDALWQKARKYNNKIRFQVRISKMAEQNQKEMMIDDNVDGDEDFLREQAGSKMPWYMLDVESTFIKSWNFFITIVIIYELVLNPFVQVFPEVYQVKNNDGDYETVTGQNKLLRLLELIVDIIFTIEIILNFMKKQRGHKVMKDIAISYLTSYFVFDVIGTFPELFMSENFEFYWLKFFRSLAHTSMITKPIELVLMRCFRKYSKTRQSDLTSFGCLLFFMIYVAHVMGCIWIKLGHQYPCDERQQDSLLNVNANEVCTQSWVYANEFDTLSITSRYIFSFYWICEVITTVGYGDYVGTTTEEYIFALGLEFLGLTFFSFLMGSISGLFDHKDSFDDLLNDKLDGLDMWVKKIEKSNYPSHLQPRLYNDIRKYVEQAYKYDFNLLIEEFDFYKQITPQMQTKLIQMTSTFNEFEKNFEHFFDECERGFTNELIINMFCRIYHHGQSVISYKSIVKDLFFIRQGTAEVFNNENDECVKDMAVLYLPTYSYFGDYQILKSLKSNVRINTLSLEKQYGKDLSKVYNPPDHIFMCIERDQFLDLCELFPQTKENLIRKSLERREFIMKQRNLNSKAYWRERGMPQWNPNKPDRWYEGKDQYGQKTDTLDRVIHDTITAGKRDEDGRLIDITYFTAQYPYRKDIRNDVAPPYQSDEEAENAETQQEDLKEYLKEANQRIDALINVLKHAEDQIKTPYGKREMVRDKYGSYGQEKKKSIVSYFDDEIAQKYLQPQQILSEKSHPLNIIDNPVYDDDQGSLEKTKTGRK